MRIGITGHRGLTSAIAGQVRRLLDEALKACAASELTAVSCLADGPDAWFAEAALRHGGRLEVVLPAEEYRAALPEWHHPAYDDLLHRADEVRGTGLTVSDDSAYMAAGEILVGLVDELLAVWDGNPARGLGGTGDVVAYARRRGVPVRVLWPEGAER